jgi:hypothetical protein
MILRRKCKEIAALLIAQEDRRLTLAERLALNFHLPACDACPKFAGQVLTMRNALKAWRAYQDDGSLAAGD